MKKELSKDLFVSKTGINFDEATELFCDETLNNLQMINVTGGKISTRGLIDLLCGLNIILCPTINVCDSSCSSEPTYPPINWDCPTIPPKNPICAAQDNCIPITYPPSLFI